MRATFAFGAWIAHRRTTSSLGRVRHRAFTTGRVRRCGRHAGLMALLREDGPAHAGHLGPVPPKMFSPSYAAATARTPQMRRSTRVKGWNGPSNFSVPEDSIVARWTASKEGDPEAFFVAKDLTI